jgi:hypothetical protein
LLRDPASVEGDIAPVNVAPVNVAPVNVAWFGATRLTGPTVRCETAVDVNDTK